jgi:hypothetical protein
MQCELLPSLGVCRLLTFHISSFFSETTGPIGAKLSRNVPCMVLYKVTVFRSSRLFNMAASSLVSEKKIFEISANQSILLALAAILNNRLERKTVTL